MKKPTLGEVLFCSFALVIIASLFLPWHRTITCGGRRSQCANNLKQLYTMGHLYSTQHEGQWPTETGEALWLKFMKTVPPLIEAEMADVYFCPVRSEGGEKGQTDYRGPSADVNLSRPADPIGADKIGNHGEGEAGCALRKAGDVQVVDLSDPLWQESKTKLSP